MALMRYPPTMPWRPSQQPWSPMEGIGSLRAEMDRLFDSFFGNMQPAGAGDTLWSPRGDLLEHDHEFVLVADLPGMQQDDIDISVQNNLLTLQGKRVVEYETQTGQNGHGYQYTERASGTFCRRFTLGAAVDTDKITATYKAGVLEVHIPKTAVAQPKRIAVKTAS